MRASVFCALLLLLLPGCATFSQWATTPGTAFGEHAPPPAPDYALPESWAALPEAAGKEGVPEQSALRADVFFLHPTTYFWRGGWNAPVDGFLTQLITSVTLRGQASAFAEAGRIFAPRFRQMTLAGFEHPDVRQAGLDLAYGDVRRAFEYYLDHFSEGRPLILAGHSQGSRHLLRLLDDFFASGSLRSRLVAAYPVGARVYDGPFQRGEAPIPVCSHARETGCLVSWRSFAPGADPALDTNPGEPADGQTICVNPLSWREDDRPVPAEANLGSIPIPIFGGTPDPQPGLVGARCAEGVLWIEPPTGCRYAIAHGDENYHAYDYELFYENVRRNALQRVGAYWEGRNDR